MAKTSGLSWTTCSVDDSGGVARAIINDVTELDFGTPRALFEWTGIDKSAMERGLGLADFTIEMSGVFNPSATTTSHAVFRTVASSTNNRTVTLVVAAATLANECLFESYELKRGDDGDLRWSTEGSLADGVVPTWS